MVLMGALFVFGEVESPSQHAYCTNYCEHV